MKISFIVTSYNIETYIDRCLRSVLEVARLGDEIIVVDDGSSDDTPAVVKACLADAPQGVEKRPVFLGQNTMGGVGIAGNIGLDMAARDGVFFVDGDDWLDVDGFNAARAAFERGDCDILIANYQEFDEANAVFKAPADEGRWCHITGQAQGEALQLQALAFIAVPWRKFYRRAFLNANGLRFPEGDFFFEDNPFHWQVCLKARQITFFDTTLCYHRINRPGQTMASTGIELIAFLDHFETILGYLQPDMAVSFHRQAVNWLLSNMSWHLQRLRPQAAPYYFRRAAEVLAAAEPEEAVSAELDAFMGTQAGLYAMMLLERGWGAALEYFLADFNRRDMDRLRQELRELKEDLLQQLSAGSNAAVAMRNIMQYESLHDAYHDVDK